MNVERVLAIGEGFRKNLIAAATLEERLAGLKPEERVMGLRPEELFMMFKPQDRLAGLDTQEKRLLLKELQASLAEEDEAISEDHTDERIEVDADSDGSIVADE